MANKTLPNAIVHPMVISDQKQDILFWVWALNIFKLIRYELLEVVSDTTAVKCQPLQKFIYLAFLPF